MLSCAFRTERRQILNEPIRGLIVGESVNVGTGTHILSASIFGVHGTTNTNIRGVGPDFVPSAGFVVSMVPMHGEPCLQQACKTPGYS
jgi:hypothetical protein